MVLYKTPELSECQYNSHSALTSSFTAPLPTSTNVRDNDKLSRAVVRRLQRLVGNSHPFCGAKNGYGSSGFLPWEVTSEPFGLLLLVVLWNRHELSVPVNTDAPLHARVTCFIEGYQAGHAWIVFHSL